jgi:hypothetical protein
MKTIGIGKAGVPALLLGPADRDVKLIALHDAHFEIGRLGHGDMV